MTYVANAALGSRKRRSNAFLVELLALVRQYWPEAEGLEECI